MLGCPRHVAGVLLGNRRPPVLEWAHWVHVLLLVLRRCPLEIWHKCRGHLRQRRHRLLQRHSPLVPFTLCRR